MFASGWADKRQNSARVEGRRGEEEVVAAELDKSRLSDATDGAFFCFLFVLARACVRVSIVKQRAHTE